MRYEFHLIPDKKDFKNMNSRELMDACCLIEREVRKEIEKKMKEECKSWELEFDGQSDFNKSRR